ncbi:MAG: hypothetical protein NUW21_16065, partial [Elusimicrobia bacterium]|nr:hypothetical protein [Elusimicrobiota bacterium]
EVQIDGTLMAPRELLNSVPYALIAKSVEGNIDVSTAGLAINANSTAVQPALYVSSVTGNVGVGTGAPVTAFDVGGSAQFGSGTTKSTFSATGALNTAGRITAPDLTATYGLSAATGAFSGSVTVGSMTSLGAAAVATEILVGGAASVATMGMHLANKNIQFSGTGGELRFTGPQAALIGHDGFFDFNLKTDGAVRQTITAAGNVGIGTTTPTNAKLEIAADSGAGLRIKPGPGGFNYIQLVTAADENLAWGLSDAGNRALRLHRYNSSGAWVDTPIEFDNTSGDIITGVAGRVGIGTPSPASKLHVLNGNIRVSTSAGQPSKGIIFQDGSVQTTAAGGTGGGWTDTGSVVQLVTPTDTIGSIGAGVTVSTHFIVSAGNVGIGTSGPASKLHMSSGTLTIDGNVATALTTAGSAGIGTSGFTPADRLEVAGGGVRLTPIAGTAGSVRLFSTLTVGAVDCAAQCGANTFCLAAWDSAGVMSTCGTAVAGNRCLCSGFGN